MAYRIDTLLIMDSPLSVDCAMDGGALDVSVDLISAGCSSIPSSMVSVSLAAGAESDMSVVFIHSESDIEYPANFVTADGTFIITADNNIFNVI